MEKYCAATDAWKATNPLPHGIAILKNVARKLANKRVETYKGEVQDSIRASKDSIREHIACYQSAFSASNYPCPLPQQLERTIAQGLPTINRFVDTLLICEMTTGILMGAQDYGQVSGQIVFDVAGEGEQFEGMRDTITCPQGETVIRDDEAILASFFQGPDKRTAINRQTSDVVFFAFPVAGIAEQDMLDALEKAVEILRPAAEEIHIQTL